MSLLKSFLSSPRTMPERPQQRQRTLVPFKTAGMVVDYETALKYSAVWRCINLISSIIATFPWHVFQAEVRGDRIVRKQMPMENPIDWALHRQANPEMSALDFRRMMFAWLLLTGNAYAEIERDAAGRVQWLWPLVPNRVTPDRNERGDLVYKVTNLRGESVVLDARSVYHLRGLGFDGLMGYSVIGMAARSIGIGLASEEFSAAYFSNGITPSGVLEHPKNLGPDAYERLKTSLTEQHGGGPSKAHGPLILEEGMIWKTISNKPEEAQLIENRRFQVSDIARWFGVPLVLLEETEKATSWGSGIEQILIGFSNFTLRPLVISAETEADIKLFGPQQRGRLVTKMNMNALLRGDTGSRKEFYKTMRELGVLSVNEIREREDMNPIGPEGDKRLVPLNFTTLEKAGEEPVESEPEEDDSGEDSVDTSDDADDNSEDTSERRRRDVETQRAVLSKTLDDIAHHEQKRCGQMCKRYRNDRTGFVRAMDRYYPGQQRHMLATLSGPVHALASMANLHVHADTVVESYIARHIQLSRLAMLDAFDTSNPMTAPDPALAVQQIIEALI